MSKKRLTDIFDRRMVQIAIKTLKTPDAIANILGHSKSKAREILKRFGYTEKQIAKIEE